MNTESNPTKSTTASKRALAAAAVGFVAITGLFVGTSTAGAIVDGAPAQITPWQVSLQDDAGHFCGGSVVDATTIVTAAHCIEGMTPSDMSVRAGVTNASDNSGQDRKVASIESHPQYAKTEVGDIAIVKLAQPLTLNDAVAPIALATPSDLRGATSATVTGWGAVSEEGDGSDVLLSAEVPLVDDSSCSTQLEDVDAMGELCAGGTGTDSCYGDSGGPLVIKTTSGPKLAGVVSWGEECGGPTPGVYAEVATYASFIAERAEDGSVSPQALQADPAEGDSATDLDDSEGREAETDIDAEITTGDDIASQLDDLTDEQLTDYLDNLSDEDFYALVDNLSDEDYESLFYGEALGVDDLGADDTDWYDNDWDNEGQVSDADVDNDDEYNDHDGCDF